MEAYAVAAWADFFAAQVGAAAALAGLLFVGLSLNLTRILQFRWLPGRAAETVVLLTMVLLVSSIALIPGQPAVLVDVELLVSGLGAWSFTVVAQARQHVRGDKPSRTLQRVVTCQVSTLPFMVAGVSLLAGTGGGLYWTVVGVLVTYLTAVLNAWVLLVEIDR